MSALERVYDVFGTNINCKGKSEGAGKELGGGGGGGLRDVVWCDDDNRIIITCSCMPSQGVIIIKKFCTKTGRVIIICYNYC